VSGVPADIRAGRLTVLLGGAAPDRARVSQTVRAYASHVIETGELGSALATKLVNNLLMAANSQLVADALRMSAAVGVEPSAFLAALNHMSGRSGASERLAENANLTEYVARVAPFFRKDVALCAELVREQGPEASLLLQVARSGPLDIT
jgi:3-hydroxyisobutyrate dehydrogenase-like beta-hydroxyacid dehydrogenase